MAIPLPFSYFWGAKTSREAPATAGLDSPYDKRSLPKNAKQSDIKDRKVTMLPNAVAPGALRGGLECDDDDGGRRRWLVPCLQQSQRGPRSDSARRTEHPEKNPRLGQRQTKHKNDQNIAWGGGLGWLRAGRSPQKQRQKGSTFVGSTVGPSLVAHGPLSRVAPRMGRLLSPTSKAALNPC